MSETRSKIASFCLKTEANGNRTALKVEIFPAVEWEDGDAGFYRLRKAGKWDDLSDDYPYRSAEAVGRYVADAVARHLEETTDVQPPRRTVHMQESCFAPYGPRDELLGLQEHCHARVVSEDTIIGADGRQYVAVSAYELGGTRLMAIDDLRFYDRAPEEWRDGNGI